MHVEAQLPEAVRARTITDLAGTTITNKNEFESRNILLASCFCHLQEKQALGRARSDFCDVIYVDVT